MGIFGIHHEVLEPKNFYQSDAGAKAITVAN
jgi:hypothetical protein